MENKPRALIVGAGISGLSAAWWLDRAGWSSILIDKSSTIQDGGYMMSLYGLGYKTVCKMDLNLKPIIYTFDEATIQDRKGKELVRLRCEDFHGIPGINLCRGDLAQALLQALPTSATIRLGETVADVLDEGDKVRATLASGETLEGDLLIGADGVRSTIRDRLWKGKNCLDQLGYSYATYELDAVDDEAKSQSACDCFLSHGRIDEFFNLRNERVAALHVWQDGATQPQDRELGFKILRDITKTAPPLVKTALERAEKSGSTPIIDTLAMVKLKHWSKGRIMLLGDSAHCLSFLSNKGAGMALASAELLSVELTKTKDVAQALVNHEKKLRPIIKNLQHRSRKMAPKYIPTSLFEYRKKKFFTRLVPNSLVVRRHEKIIKYENNLIIQ
ncbi:unnamed protein product [Clonostachys byssicola]|uniref:FAD-binding domain-containing protein n=1 Tax=Clonostachys byssicola TaxID=160290 RepID=A0A9N9Y183_9HYPO|nr:unnamed protein product [Clonostachys byssicola]